MAQFRATIKGQRGEASRLGSKKTGIVANVNGWTTGIRIEAGHVDGRDVFRVFATSGSGRTHSDTLLGTLTQDQGGINAWGWLPEEP
jgi:hypothetical protein